MINITNIKCGWLCLSLANNKFYASYLTDVIYELDSLIDKCSVEKPTKIYIDGEGKDLYLTAWLNYDDKIIIIWEEYSNSELLHIMKFDYEEFKNQYEQLKERIKEDYNENFISNIFKDYYSSI